jgi:hypothetical protein
MEETWMVFLLPETGLNIKRLTSMAAGYRLRTKETCFGALVEGERPAVMAFVGGVKKRYPRSIYVKRRGFSIEDTEICAATFRPGAEEGLPPWLPRYAGQIRRYTS